MRIVALTHDWGVIGDLDPGKTLSAKVIEEINGEHALVVETLQELAKGDRLLWLDGSGAWHEYVVYGIASRRIGPDAVSHTCYCPWSLQYDLQDTTTTAMPGTGGTPASATTALQGALQGTSRWTVGTVQPTTTGSASFWRMSGWEALQKVVSIWGGEVSADISVSPGYGITRSVSLVNHVGSSTPTHRFDYGADMSSVERSVLEQPWTCRVIPLGAAEEADGGGYGRKITIESVNSGVAWLENASTANLVRKPDGNGGWEYPTQHVENPEAKTPTDLKAWALANLDQWTTPKVSYTLGVLQLASSGTSGVQCGDEVIVVDPTFGSSGLRLQARAVRVELDLIDPTATKVTFSNVAVSLGMQLAELSQATTTTTTLVEDTNDYIRTVIREEDEGTMVVSESGQGRFSALVNPDGSFDVVEVTWSDGTPTIGDWWARVSASGFEYVDRDASGEPHLLMDSDTLEIGYSQGRKLTWSPTDGLRMQHRTGNVPITDLLAEPGGTLRGAHAYGWNLLAPTSGTTEVEFGVSYMQDGYELSYSELLVVARYGTGFAASVVVPVAELTSSYVDWYLGAWSSGSSDYNACCKLKLDAITPYLLKVGGTDTSGDWMVYAR